MPEDIAYAVVGTLTKSRVDDDGVLHFEMSKATGPDLDHEGMRVDMNWGVPAMREWFATGANLREQHDKTRAIGKAMSLEERDDGMYIAGKIVDPISIRKVQEDVLPYLSIGVAKHKLDYTQKALAPGGLIVGGKIVEVSLCDRPVNPNTKLVIGKAAEPDDHFENVSEVVEPDAEKAERVEHSHSHQHSDGQHRHQHNHGPNVAEHRALDSGVAHNHQHADSDPDVVADRAEGLSDADTSGAKAIDADMVKAVLSAADRAALPASDFAIPSRRPGPGSYPINDAAHARDALARSKGKPEEGTVRAAVKRKYPDMDIEDDSDKSEAPDLEQTEGDLALLVKAAKPSKSNPDPDNDGDDDTTASGDTDHDYWNEDGSPTAKGKAAGMKAKAATIDRVAEEDRPILDALKADTPGLIKTITADPDMVAELRKALGIDEAESKRQEEITDLKSQLEKALDIPILTPPSRTAPAGAKAVTAAKADLTAKRDRYQHLADTAQDQVAYAGYLAKAEQIDEELSKLA